MALQFQKINRPDLSPHTFEPTPHHRGLRGLAELSMETLGRRHTREDQSDFCSLAVFAVEIAPAAQAMGHDVVDDMQAEAGVALITASCEKWIEGLALDVGTHIAAVVGEQNFDIVVAR